MLSYINALPFWAPFKLGKINHHFEFISGVPSYINNAFKAREIDIALMSSYVVIQNKLENRERFPYGIASDGHVGSVCLFTKWPVKELNGKKIGLSNQSETSVQLLKILCKFHWNIRPEFLILSQNETNEKFDAFLLIGDDCLKYKNTLDYTKIDLGKEWQKTSNLPFVYALFGVNELPENKVKHFSAKLNEAFLWSKTHFESIEQIASIESGLCNHAIKNYYKLLQYELTDHHWKGLKCFEELTQKL